MSREAMQRLAASGSYIVVTDINVWRTAELYVLL